jgi:hypothetical protein
MSLLSEFLSTALKYLDETEIPNRGCWSATFLWKKILIDPNVRDLE